jgi:hypothetical protein
MKDTYLQVHVGECLPLAAVAALTVTFLVAVAALTVASLVAVAAFTVAFFVAEAALTTLDVVDDQMPKVEDLTFPHLPLASSDFSPSTFSPPDSTLPLSFDLLVPMLVVDSDFLVVSFIVAITANSAGSSLIGRSRGFLAGDFGGLNDFVDDFDFMESALFDIVGLGGTAGTGIESCLFGGGGRGGGATSFSLMAPLSPSEDTGIEFSEVVDELEDILRSFFADNFGNREPRDSLRYLQSSSIFYEMICVGSIEAIVLTIFSIHKHITL